MRKTKKQLTAQLMAVQAELQKERRERAHMEVCAHRPLSPVQRAVHLCVSGACV